MKLFLATLMTLTSLTASAQVGSTSRVNVSANFDASASADWVVEASTMLIGGKAAKDLYNSLRARETIDPLSTSHDQFRSKQNSFAQCSASFYRIETQDGAFEWIMHNNVECRIQAPAGTTINQ